MSANRLFAYSIYPVRVDQQGHSSRVQADQVKRASCAERLLTITRLHHAMRNYTNARSLAWDALIHARGLEDQSLAGQLLELLRTLNAEQDKFDPPSVTRLPETPAVGRRGTISGRKPDARDT